jgi:hypothetical protein
VHHPKYVAIKTAGIEEETAVHKRRESAAIACTLSATDYNERLARIQQLNTAALRDYRRDGSRIELTYNRSARRRVRAFVRQERQCCPFLDFTIHDEKDALIMVIEAPEDAGATADALFAPYTQQGSPGED